MVDVDDLEEENEQLRLENEELMKEIQMEILNQQKKVKVTRKRNRTYLFSLFLGRWFTCAYETCSHSLVSITAICGLVYFIITSVLVCFSFVYRRDDVEAFVLGSAFSLGLIAVSIYSYYQCELNKNL